MSKRTRPLHLIDSRPDPLPGPIDIDLGEESSGNNSSITNGVRKTEHADGSATIDFSPERMPSQQDNQDDFYRNLANDIDPSEQDRIASELITGFESDERSRQEWLETRARGIVLIGLKLDEPRGDVGTSSAPLEGMSTVRHPLLLEATLRFQANARGELLPAAGPVKIRNDRPTKPLPLQMPPMPPPQPGAPPQPPPSPIAVPQKTDPTGFANSAEELAGALEKDFNHYLTAIAT